MKGYLALRDIGVFTGQYFGWNEPCSGEVAHFRSKDFYWDLFTDPAYHKKIVITDRVYVEDKSPPPEENQSFMPHLSAMVFLGAIKRLSGKNGTGLEEYLHVNRIAGFIPDRRDLLFDALGLGSNTTGGLCRDRETAVDFAERPAVCGADDIKSVTTPQEYFWDLAPGEMPEEKYNLVVWDFGTGYNLLRTFRKIGCRIRVVPSGTDPEEIVALHPDGIIMAGSPLSPDGTKKIIPKIERVIGIRPILGVGGGAVILSQALGIDLINLTDSHYGSSIPVEDIKSGAISATHQSHTLTIDPISAERSGCTVTHVNVCDNTVEAFINDDYRAAGSFYNDSFGLIPDYIMEFGRLLRIKSGLMAG